MTRHVIIDGNNLLFTMQACAPLPSIGRETLVRIIEAWAGERDDLVSLVFDGPEPAGGLSAQMRSSRIEVAFSAPKSADDVIVAMIHSAGRPDLVRVVSSDTAIRHEARVRRCHWVDGAAFVGELFPEEHPMPKAKDRPDEKPDSLTADEAKRWLSEFGLDDGGEPFAGHDAMNG